LIERALTLDFLSEPRNCVIIGSNGLGKTMIAKNIAHAAVLAGHSVLFRTAAICSLIWRAIPPACAAASFASTPDPLS